MRHIRRNRLAQLIEHTGGKGVAQQRFCVDRVRVERQRIFKMADRFGKVFTCWSPTQRCPAAKNIVESVRVLGWPSRFGADQGDIERNGYLAGHLVLQPEEVVRGMVEAVGPNMNAGFGIDQLGVDADAVTRTADTAFEDVSDVQLPAELPA